MNTVLVTKEINADRSWLPALKDRLIMDFLVREPSIPPSVYHSAALRMIPAISRNIFSVSFRA